MITLLIYCIAETAHEKNGGNVGSGSQLDDRSLSTTTRHILQKVSVLIRAVSQMI